ncbi:hypothetical protein CNMCM5793_009361 [Aspergillus hiratsukae]|uniref:N-acetyltransferase domain-containing protein n=1 Tax=Aspergillus hiratsukae TaxID=1194566 RepID=A0A8H6QJ35_9EURO|nr:hypothetical protein CNMCM5793_009361 [Aspergillus hiratsukae]KAF7173933.1 hypothetical protein CNMCM6106_008019 [Aspergillus hiratsukae]
MYGALSHEDPDPPFAADLQRIIREDAHAQILKAVDEHSGRIVGWAWWSIYRDAKAHAKAEEEGRERVSSPPTRSLCPVLQVLVVHPSYQGRGIGTKLLMVGVEEARRLGLHEWLEASEAGYALYRRCGFRDAERMELYFGKYGLTGLRHVYCMLMDDVVNQKEP